MLRICRQQDNVWSSFARPPPGNPRTAESKKWNVYFTTFRVPEKVIKGSVAGTDLSFDTEMSRRLRRQADCLRVLSKANPKLRKAILSTGSADLVKSICDCSHNLLTGNIPLTPAQKRGLSRHKTTLRQLNDKKIPLSKKRQTQK